MDFKSATDRLLACGVMTRDIADAAVLSLNSVARMRLSPATPSYRRPPADWPELLIEVSLAHAAARDRSALDLRALAGELKRGAKP